VVKVMVPATTANLGPGFDTVGAALTLYNRFEFTPASAWGVTLQGCEARHLQLEPEDNLVHRAFYRLYAEIAQTPPPMQLTIDMGIPFGSGLGSSATAIVGGLVGANHCEGQPLGLRELIKLAIEIEGHPDNVVPALLGGCQLALPEEEDWYIADIPWYPAFIPVIATPDFAVSTEAARGILPPVLSMKDAVFNVAHFGLLVRALETGREDWLRVALKDKMHQSHRSGLIQGYRELYDAALGAGAYGLVISGAGPSLLAIAHADEANAVAATMEATWRELGINPKVRILSIDTVGARVV